MSAIRVHDRDITVERFTMTKGMRVITLLQLIQKMVPQISKAIADFKREYSATNVVELDRVQAKMRYGPTPIVDEHGDVVRDPDGTVSTIASPIDRMTEADWERSGQVLRLRQSPSNEELLLAVFPLVYEHAQAPVLRLLALVAMPNTDVERYAQVSGEKLWEQVDEFAAQVIGPAYLEQVMELAVTAAEQVEGQVMDKVRGLGDRVGKLTALFGKTKTTPAPPASPTSSASPEQPSSESASASPDSSDGSPATSSPSPGTPSTRSATSSSSSETVNAN